MTDVNIPLLRKAVEWVETQSELPRDQSEWEQDWWITTAAERTEEFGHPCGTAYCVAGYVAALVDPRFVSTSLVDGTSSMDVAADALGDASAVLRSGLFQATNKAEDVRRIAEEIAGERL